MGWPGPLTHRQFTTWMLWLYLEQNNPSRTDYYLMQLNTDLRGIFSKKAKMEDCRLRWKLPNQGNDQGHGQSGHDQSGQGVLKPPPIYRAQPTTPEDTTATEVKTSTEATPDVKVVHPPKPWSKERLVELSKAMWLQRVMKPVARPGQSSNPQEQTQQGTVAKESKESGKEVRLPTGPLKAPKTLPLPSLKEYLESKAKESKPQE